MFDETYGLRFDIYERVHLSDEVIGIDQLEEVELTPHIQIIPNGEQVTVRGSLLLSGAYVGISDNGTSQTLEHWIPVEITLPLSRVRSLEEIHVDIDHFDVDLLSTRSLNITGVLSLKGIYLENQETPAWQQEQFTVEYETSGQAADEPSWIRDYSQPAANAEPEPASEEGAYESQEKAAISSVEYTSSSPIPESDPSTVYEIQTLHSSFSNATDASASAWSWSGQEAGIQGEASTLQQRDQASAENSITGATSTWTWDQSPWGSASTPSQSLQSQSQQEGSYMEETNSDAEARQPEATQAAEQDISNMEEGVVASDAQSELQAIEEAISSSESRDDDTPQEQAPTEKKEVRVAIGGSPVSSDGDPSQGLGFSKLLHSSKQARDKEREAVERQSQEQSGDQEAHQKTTGDDVHWQSLFLNQIQDESSFRKVRLCIVQREDTLDSIAERYQLNAREIALYNRLPESIVSEGQVIYIPS